MSNGKLLMNLQPGGARARFQCEFQGSVRHRSNHWRQCVETKDLFLLLEKGPSHAYTQTHTHTHTHTPFLYIFLNTTKTVQTLTQTGPHISSCLKVDCTLKSRVITEDSIIDNVKVYTSDLFVLKSKSCRTTFNSMCT